jgi:hypothetical protein
VWDLQGLVAEDGQLYIMEPQYVDMQTNSKHNSAQLDAFIVTTNNFNSFEI